MRYEVAIVGHGDLPAGINKVIVEREGALPLLLINGEPARCWQFMRAWVEAEESAEATQCATPLPAAPPPRPLTGWQALALG